MDQISTNQDRTHLERMISMLTDNLHVYEEQAAAFGELYVPPFLVHQINDTRAEISRLQEELGRLKTSPVSDANIIPKVPHNLPSPIRLIGREKELTDLSAALADPSITSVIIEGLMGTGKTALSGNLANDLWLTGEYKGAVWVSAENGILTLNTMLDTLATILDYPNLVRLVGEEKKHSAINVLRSRKILLILDGFEELEDDIEISNFLSLVPFPSKVLLTRNKRGDSYSNSYFLSLKGLDAPHSIALIRHECNRLNIQGVEKLPHKTMQRLHELTSGNPYAIKLSIGQIKRFGLTFDSILSRLVSAQGQLFEHIYDSNWRSMKQDQQLILKAISVLGGSTSLVALQEIIGMPFVTLESNLAELVEMSLVETNFELEREKIRYGILSLTRTYVLNSLRNESDLQNKLFSQTADYYLEFCRKNKKTFMALQDELENLRIVMDWCRNERKDLYIQFSRLLYPFFRDVGYWQDALLHLGYAIEISRNARQKEELGWLGCELASILIRMGGEQELDAAMNALCESQIIFDELEDPEGLCAVFGRQARVAHKRKDFQSALTLGLQALKLAKEKNLVSRIADIQHELGDTYRLAGDLDAAKVHYEESLKNFQSLKDTIRVAGRLNDLANLALQDDRLMDAKSLFIESIDLCEQNNKMDTLTRALNGLALVEERLNYPLRSYHSAFRAREIADKLGAAYENKQASDTAKRMQEKIAKQTVWIFNFNNTLADTHILNVEAWVMSCQHFGLNIRTLDLENELKQGSSSKKISQRLGIATNVETEAIKLKRSIFRDNALRELRLYPDVEAVLADLHSRGNLVTICSMMPEAIILETFKRSQLSDIIDKFVGLESLTDRRDNITAKIQAVELILEYIPADKSHFVIVGDSVEENSISRRIGIRHIHFSRFATTQEMADNYPSTAKSIKAFDELLSL
jgi:phosphoglycolate phosphatase-like HAD superfamily hydrolase